jgi:Flp pilus assembly protein TadG
VTRRPGRDRPLAAGPVTLAEFEAEQGMVTAEFAVALPAFVIVVVAALCGVAVVTAQLRCADAADIAARMAARGDSTTLVTSTALNDAPGTARLDLATTAELVTATVSAKVSPLGLARFLPSVVVTAHVVEAREPSAPVAAIPDGTP